MMMKSLKQNSDTSILKDVVSIATLFLVVGIFILSLGITGKEPITKSANASTLIINDYDCNIKQEMVKLQPARPIYDYKAYAFKINNKIVTVSEQQLYDVIYNYVKENVCKEQNNSIYLNKVTKSYIRLFDECGKKYGNDAILRYIGLCKVESNFNSSITSHCGAYGIPQVLLSVWKNVMKDNWNILVKDYKSDIYSQLYVGLMIYNVYLKKNKGNISKAHSGYSGGHLGYHSRIMKQNNILKQKVKTCCK